MGYLSALLRRGLHAAGLALCAALFFVAPAAAGLSIVDDAGQTITLAHPARRIVPLYAGLGEILAALGMAELAVGRTASDDALPSELPVVGTHMRPNPEIIAGLAPDLALQFEGREEAGMTARTLTGLGIPVARFRIADFESLFSCMKRIGLLTGKEDAAKEAVAAMRARLDAVRKDMEGWPAKPAVFFEVRYPNLLGAGAGGMAHDIIVRAGGENCLKRRPERMVRLSEESLALMDPGIYLVQRGPMNKKPLPLPERPHFRKLTAVRCGLYREVEESLFSRPGPRGVEAVEQLARIIRMWQLSACRPLTEGELGPARPGGPERKYIRK